MCVCDYKMFHQEAPAETVKVKQNCFRLVALLEEISNNAEPGAKTLIFVETKKKVETITKSIRRYGWPAVCMHGDKSQQERDYVLREFRNGKSNILVATDVAARGLGELVSEPYVVGNIWCSLRQTVE